MVCRKVRRSMSATVSHPRPGGYRSVFSWPFDTIDQIDFDRSFARFQFESELLLQCNEKRRERGKIGVGPLTSFGGRGAWSSIRRRRPVAERIPLELDIEQTLNSRIVLYRPARVHTQDVRQVVHVDGDTGKPPWISRETVACGLTRAAVPIGLLELRPVFRQGQLIDRHFF